MTTPEPIPFPGTYPGDSLLDGATHEKREKHRTKLHQLRHGIFGRGKLQYPNVGDADLDYRRRGVVLRAAMQSGDTRHHRLPRLVRLVPPLVAVIDCVVLLTFCAVVFNVDLGHPLQYPIATLAAVLLAVLACGVSYVVFTVTGKQIRQYRSSRTEVQWHLVGGTTWILVAMSALLVAVLAMLMYQRILAEVVAAGMDQSGAGSPVLLALVFAVIGAVANLAVVAVHALDGSTELDDFETLGRLLRRHERRVNRLRRRIRRLGGDAQDEDLLSAAA